MNPIPELSTLNLSDLNLTPYCQISLRRIVDAHEFYMDIYRTCLDRVLELCSKAPADMTVVDFGGGHGLLSILAKRLGFGSVIYVDSNADSVQMARMISDRLGAAPDVFIHGDEQALHQWCGGHSVRPDALLAMDVIEHIYVLDAFFSAMHEISPSMKMVFTTASTPYNKRVIHRLHKAMEADELGTVTRKGFWKMRRDYIEEHFPDMPERELDYWADNTRGLVYRDVERAVESQSPNLLLDDFNTCDPVTGSWTERILPIDDYRQLLIPYGYTLTVLPGRYNEYRRGPKKWVGHCHNITIDRAPSDEPRGFRQRRRYRKALRVAPFIYMIVK